MRKWKPYCNPRDSSAWYSVSQAYPTSQGTYRAMCGFESKGAITTTSPGTMLRWAVFDRLGSGSVIGTSTKLYVNKDASLPANGPAWFDTSVSGGYSASDWSFALFGNVILAVNGSGGVTMQAWTRTGSFAGTVFAAVSGAPQAAVIVVQSNAVLAFNTSGGTNGDDFAASDVGDHTNWSTGDAVASTAIRHRPGQILDAVAFQDYVLAFKGSSIYRLRYVGGVVKWAVELVADGLGVANYGTIVNTGARVYFWDKSGPYVYDGTNFKPIAPTYASDAVQVGSSLTSSLGSSVLTIKAGTYLPIDKLVVWMGSTGLMLCYNEVSDAWGNFTPYKSDGTALTSGYVLSQIKSGHLGIPLTNRDSSTDLYVISLSDAIYAPQLTCAPTGISTKFKATPVGDEQRLTTWTRLIPVLSNPVGVPQSDTTSTLASTDLKLNIKTSENPFYFGQNITYGDQGSGTTTPSSSPVTSSDNQIRFDFTVTDRWAEFEVYATAKFFEIEDIIVVGSLGGTD